MKKTILLALASMVAMALAFSSCKPKEEPNVKINLQLSSTSIVLKVGEEKQLDYNLTPSTATISFSVENEKIATVNEKGVVKGIANGKTTVTLKAGEVRKKVSISVYSEEVDKSEYEKRMIGSKEDPLYPPFYVPEESLIPIRLNTMQKANGEYKWVYYGKAPIAGVDDCHIFIDEDKNGNVVDNRKIHILGYGYSKGNSKGFIYIQSKWENAEGIANDKKLVNKLRSFATAYGFTEHSEVLENFPKGIRNKAVVAINESLGENEVLQGSFYWSQNNKDNTKVSLTAMIIYAKPHSH